MSAEHTATVNVSVKIVVVPEHVRLEPGHFYFCASEGILQDRGTASCILGHIPEDDCYFHQRSALLDHLDPDTGYDDFAETIHVAKGHS